MEYREHDSVLCLTVNMSSKSKANCLLHDGSHTYSKSVRSLAAAVCILKGASNDAGAARECVRAGREAVRGTTVISGHNTCSLIIAYCILK